MPDGLVVLAGAADNDRRAIAAHPWFDELPEDAVLAVRSSGIGEDGAGQSFAGIHQTFLDVPRPTSIAPSPNAWRRRTRPQALEYREAKGISTDAIRMGVLIQRMVRPIASGVAFTLNPVTGARDEVVINASWGIGEALVSGQIDPDEFVVGKADGEVRWSRIGDKGGDGNGGRCLSPDQVGSSPPSSIASSATTARRRTSSGASPAIGFWIVQSRPVTTTAAPDGETEWTRANIGEVMPDVTSPQVLAVFDDLLNRAERQASGPAAGS